MISCSAISRLPTQCSRLWYTRFRTYKIELERDADSYCETTMAMPAMQEWVAAASNEPMIVEAFEFWPPIPLMLLAGRAEADRRPFLGRGAQIPGVAGEEDRHAVMVLGQGRAVAVAEAVEFGALAVEPARRLVRGAVEPGGEPVLGLRGAPAARRAAARRRRRRSSRCRWPA